MILFLMSLLVWCFISLSWLNERERGRCGIVKGIDLRGKRK